MFPTFDYNHEKDEYKNGYSDGQGDKGFDDGENEFAFIGLFAFGLNGILNHRVFGGGTESLEGKLEGFLAGIHFTGLLHGELKGNLNANVAGL